MPPALALPRARAFSDATRAARACLDASRFAAASEEEAGGAEGKWGLEVNARARAPRAARPAAAEDTAEPPWVHVFARELSTRGGDRWYGARAAANGEPCDNAAATTRRAPCLSMPRRTCSAAKWRRERVFGVDELVISTHERKCRMAKTRNFVFDVEPSESEGSQVFPSVDARQAAFRNRGRDDTPPCAVASSPISGLLSRDDGDGENRYVRARLFEPIRRPAPPDLRERLGTRTMTKRPKSRTSWSVRLTARAIPSPSSA